MTAEMRPKRIEFDYLPSVSNLATDFVEVRHAASTPLLSVVFSEAVVQFCCLHRIPDIFIDSAPLAVHGPEG